MNIDACTYLQSDTHSPALSPQWTCNLCTLPPCSLLGPSVLKQFLGCPRFQLQALAMSWNTKSWHLCTFQGSLSLLSRVDTCRRDLISELESAGKCLLGREAPRHGFHVTRDCALISCSLSTVCAVCVHMPSTGFCLLMWACRTSRSFGIVGVCARQRPAGTCVTNHPR